MANQPKKYKKFVATAATATLVASAIVPVASAAHTDTEGHQFESYINEATKLGLFNDGGEFKPGNKLTRKHVVLILGRYLEDAGFKPAADYTTKPAFTDLGTADAEFIRLASVVKEAGIFHGDNGKINGGQNISRQHMAKVLDGLAEAVAGKSLVDAAADIEDAKVTDLDAAGASYRAQIQALADFGITTVEKFNPKGEVTRGQFAKFIIETIGAIEKIKPTPTDKLAEEVKAVEEAVKTLPAEVTKENAADAQKAVDAVKAAVAALEKAAGEDASDEVKAAIKDANEAANKTQEAIDKANDKVVVGVKVESAAAVNAKTVAVTFDKDVTKADLKVADFKVSNLAVTNVSVNGKVATLTLSSELSNGTTYTVDFEKEGSEKSSANFLYAVEVEKGIALTKTTFTIYQNQSYENIFNFVNVKDANGKEVPESQIASKDIETDNTNVISTATAEGVKKGDIKGQGAANINIKYTLTDGTVLETGKIAITATNQDAKNSAGFSINAAPFANTVAFKLAQAANNHKTILYPGQGTDASLHVYAFDANNDPLTEEVKATNSELVEYSVTSGDTLLQVNKNTGAVIYQSPSEGKATVKAKKGNFSYDAQVELRKTALLTNVVSTKSALQVAETNAANKGIIDESLHSDDLNLNFLDQYGTAFKKGLTNNENNIDTKIAEPKPYKNDADVEIGKEADITYTSHDGVERKGKVVVTADSNKLKVALDNTTGKVTVASTSRDITVDESVNLTITLYDTNDTNNPKVLKTVVVPVKIKDVTEPTAQKLFKSNDINASGLASSAIDLWEVDKDGDKIRQVKQGVATTNRGKDLVDVKDDVILSSNDIIEFEAVIDNTIADAFIKENAANSAHTASATSFKEDNILKITADKAAAAVATYTFADAEFDGKKAIASLLYGEDVTFTVKAKTGDASGSQLLTAQTVDVRAYNSKSVAKSATVKATNTIDISETNKVIGAAADAPIAIKNALLGFYDKSEYIIDKIADTNTIIALKNGQDGTIVSPVISLKDQSSKELKLGPVSYGELAASFENGAVSINDRILAKIAGYADDQTLEFEATLLDFENVTGLDKIGAKLTGSENITLDTDKEQGTVKVLLTGVYRSDDSTNALVKKNLLPASQIVTLTFTK